MNLLFALECLEIDMAEAQGEFDATASILRQINERSGAKPRRAQQDRQAERAIDEPKTQAYLRVR